MLLELTWRATMEAKVEKKSFLKTPWKVFASILALALIGGGVFWYIEYSSRFVWTNDAFIEGYGSELSSNVTEKVLELFVDEGEYVKKGQKIAKLQNNVPLAKREEIQASIISQTQEIMVKEAHYLKLKSDYGRALESLKDQIISIQNFQHVERNYQMAKAELDLSVANLDLAKKKLQVIDAQLIHYDIESPQDGFIAKRWVWLGDTVSPGQSLFTLYDLDDVWVLANLEEKKLRKVKIGDKVDIHVDAYPGITFEGDVFAIKGAAASKFTLIPQNNATGNYTKVEQRIPIKISIKRPKDYPKNKPLYLFPGMSVEIYVNVK